MKYEIKWVSKKFWEEVIKAEPILTCTKANIDLADDWIMVCSEDCDNVKYGRLMWSKKLNRARAEDMEEFYNGGIVD